MEAPPGFEPGMEVLQTSALPLGDGALEIFRWTAKPAEAGSLGPRQCTRRVNGSEEIDTREEERLERETGFEPATSTLARSHSTTELFPLLMQ